MSNLTKSLSVALCSLALSSVAFAGPDMETRLQTLENQMKQVRTETAAGTYGANTATARPEVDGHGVFMSVDVLYWHAKVGGTEYVYTSSNANASYPVQGRYKGNDFDWDWGFRVGLGYNFEHDGWDAYVNYTYYDTNDASRATSGDADALIPQKGTASIFENLLGSPGLTYVGYANSNWKFDFDNVDIELGRNYFVSRSLSFRPHFGLKSTWLNLTNRVTYTAGELGDDNSLKIRDDNDFWGMGPRCGVNTKWHLTNGFSVFGNVAGSLLFGYYKVKHDEYVTNTPDTDKLFLKANMHRFAPNAQMVIGLSHDRYVFNDKQHVCVSLGWEIDYYWRMNQIVYNDESTTKKFQRYSEDVTMYGATLKVRWDF